MRSTNNPGADGFTWDGAPKNRRATRFLRVAPDSPTRLLRTAQSGRCAACGNHIEWYYRAGDRTIVLHPRELPAADIPSGERWHVNSGMAHPTDDDSLWCRISHHALCPATDMDAAEDHRGVLAGLRRQLALNSRRLIEAGTFTPRPDPPPTTTPAPVVRPVVQFLYLNYVAPGPLEQIQCVAQTRARHRCPHPLLDPAALPGTWILQPVHPAGGGQLPLPADCMAVYDLTHLPYSEQLRWRAQRCPAHAAAPAAADTARTAWEPFNPLTHHQHIQHHLPGTPHPPQQVRR
jgi:hypothetical protein